MYIVRGKEMVLLVEHEDIVGEVGKEMFASLSYEVVEARNGRMERYFQVH